MDWFEVNAYAFESLSFLVHFTQGGVPCNKYVFLKTLRGNFDVAPDLCRDKLEVKENNEILTYCKEDFVGVSILGMSEEENVLDTKGYEALSVGVFGHVKEDFTIDSIGCNDNVIFTHHKQVVIDIGKHSVVLNISVKPVKNQCVQSLVEKVLRNIVAFLVLTNYVQC